MHFGKKLLAARHEPWAAYYLDYERLKSLLEDDNGDARNNVKGLLVPNAADEAITSSLNGGAVVVIDEQQQQAQARRRRPSGGSTSLHSLGWLPEGGFLQVLNREVEKIFLFFLAEQGHLASELAQVQQEIMRMMQQHQDPLLVVGEASKQQEESDLSQSVQELSVHLLRLIQYVELNVNGIRKILKKHDKLSKTKLTAKYLGRKGPLLQPLLTNESLDGLIRVCNATLEMWKDWKGEQRILLHGEEPMQETKNSSGSASGYGSSSRPKVQAVSPMTWTAKGYGTSASSSNLHRSLSGTINLEDAPTEHVLHKIREARKKLQQTNEFVQVLAAPMMVQEGDSEDGESIQDQEEDEGKRPSSFSNFLNLMSTFLYMANYYIVAPASSTYAEKLGSDPSISGMIIGMTPVAALVSTLLYSWWTSYSYKSALIFASTCSLLGNILYAAGLPLNSLTLVMLGRLLNGFGSARSINRRYIADTFSRNERTAASAAFVTAGALGMAAGPALASLLNFTVSGENSNPYWQVENAPGWFMFGAWTVYLACLIYFFADPPKRHYLPPPPKDESEKQALLSKGELAETDDSSVDLPFWENTPTFVTFAVYFVLKLALESVLSSSGLITRFYFHWSGRASGFFLAGLGLLMLPANFVVAFMSRRYDDRELIRGLVVLMLVGCLGVVQYSETYTMAQYIIAAVVIFLSTNALEGPNMSLLSKTIPHSWSKGFFNVGLLATEAGTLGRAVADVLLTVCGSGGTEYLLNSTFLIMAALSFLSLLLVVRFWGRLEPREKDD